MDNIQPKLNVRTLARAFEHFVCAVTQARDFLEFLPAYRRPHIFLERAGRVNYDPPSKILADLNTALCEFKSGRLLFPPHLHFAGLERAAAEFANKDALARFEPDLNLLVPRLVGGKPRSFFVLSHEASGRVVFKTVLTPQMLFRDRVAYCPLLVREANRWSNQYDFDDPDRQGAASRLLLAHFEPALKMPSVFGDWRVRNMQAARGPSADFAVN